MARIEWTLLCELAFLDQQKRLCIVGVTTELPVPRLPLAVNQLMLVARLADLRKTEEIEVAAGVTSPAGIWKTPPRGDGLVIEMAHGYIFVTLRGLPLQEEGVHTFSLMVSGRPPVSLDVPVVMARRALKPDVH
jgi:hypothetical protein